MTDIEKIKIDILGDALKDAIDTVRALDRKIIFLVSYNAIFFLILIRLFLNSSEVKILIKNIQTLEVFYALLGTICLVWVFNLIKIMLSISPESNPINVFKKREDKDFSNNTFFIFTGGEDNILDLNELKNNYQKIDSYEEIEKLLYKEIGKVSYIRDIRQNGVNEAVKWSSILTAIFIMFITIFIIYSW